VAVKILESLFFLRLPITQVQRFQLNHYLELSTSYNDVFDISSMRFYNVAQLQFTVEFQNGKILIWGPLLSLNVGWSTMGDFEESAQETAVCFKIHSASQPQGS
jgi:hypothetical protein